MSKRRELHDKVKRSTVAICIRDSSGDFVPFGSGFNVQPSGLVVTCRHVVFATLLGRIPRSEEITSGEIPQHEWFCVFTFEDSKGVSLGAFRPVITGGLHDRDLAVARLKIDSKEIETLPYLDMGDSDSVCEGDRVFTCGFPLGKVLQPGSPSGGLFLRGIVSGIRPHRIVHPRNLFFLDMTINEGNSGGALFSEESASVVGVVNALWKRPEGIPSGISSAVPLNSLRPMIQDMAALSEDDIEKTRRSGK